MVKAAERPYLLCWKASSLSLSLAKQDEEKLLVFDRNISEDKKKAETGFHPMWDTFDQILEMKSTSSSVAFLGPLV